MSMTPCVRAFANHAQLGWKQKTGPLMVFRFEFTLPGNQPEPSSIFMVAVSLLVVWKVTTMFALNYAPKPGTGSSPSITGCVLNMCTRHSLMTVGRQRTGPQPNSATH